MVTMVTVEARESIGGRRMVKEEGKKVINYDTLMYTRSNVYIQ